MEFECRDGSPSGEAVETVFRASWLFLPGWAFWRWGIGQGQGDQLSWLPLHRISQVQQVLDCKVFSPHAQRCTPSLPRVTPGSMVMAGAQCRKHLHAQVLCFEFLPKEGNQSAGLRT